MNVQLVDNASSWWKMYSNWVFGFIAIVAAVEPFVPALQAVLPGNTGNFLMAAVALGGIAARLVKQFNLTSTKEEA